MGSKRKSIWLISPKSFIQMIGTEYEILRKSGSASLIRFYIAAVTIVIILMISACSIFYAMKLLFHLLHVELLFAIFVSLLFVFIYVFLLNTFSKNIFKEKPDDGQKLIFWGINLSDIIRTTFVVFMAFLISKPIEVFIYKDNLTEKVIKHRSELLSQYTRSLDSLYEKDINQLKGRIKFYQEQVTIFQSTNLHNEIALLNFKISEIQSRETQQIETAKQRIEGSDFLLFRIRQVSKKPIAWLICIGLVSLFLLPGFLIYSLSATDAYYKLKKEYEVSLVREEYQAFEILYTDIFKKAYQLDRAYYSKFLDPPFNNKLKPSPKFDSQKDFLNKYSSV